MVATHDPHPQLDQQFDTVAPRLICLQHNVREQVNPEHFDPNDWIAGDDDFVTSIENQGILERCTVRPPREDERLDGHELCIHGLPYIAVTGHRRITAEALCRGEDSISVPIEIVDEDRELSVLHMLVENLQRSDLTPVEEGRGYVELVKQHGWRQDEVAKSVGRSSAHVSERIKLLTAPPEALARVQDGTLAIRAALELVGQRDPLIVDEALQNIDARMDAKEAVSRAVHDVKSHNAAEDMLQQLWDQGVSAGRSKPSGAKRVLVKDETTQMYAGATIRLTLTGAQFKRKPDAYLVVTKASRYNASTHPTVEYYTTDPAKYETPDEPGATLPPDVAPRAPQVDHEAERKGWTEVIEHRIAWLENFATLGVTNDQVLTAVVPAMLERVWGRSWGILAHLLKLVADGEQLDGEEGRNRVRAYLATTKMSEQMRVIWLGMLWEAAYERWKPTPQLLLQAGYELTEFEVAQQEAAAAEAAQDAEEHQAEWDELVKAINVEPSYSEDDKISILKALDEARKVPDAYADEFEPEDHRASVDDKPEPEDTEGTDAPDSNDMTESELVQAWNQG